MNQTTSILTHLEQHGSITPLEALDEYNCFRLGARIYDLRHSGHNIITKTVKRGSKSFAKYCLNEF